MNKRFGNFKAETSQAVRDSVPSENLWDRIARMALPRFPAPPSHVGDALDDRPILTEKGKPPVVVHSSFLLALLNSSHSSQAEGVLSQLDADGERLLLVDLQLLIVLEKANGARPILANLLQDGWSRLVWHSGAMVRTKWDEICDGTVGGRQAIDSVLIAWMKMRSLVRVAALDEAFRHQAEKHSLALVPPDLRI